MAKNFFVGIIAACLVLSGFFTVYVVERDNHMRKLGEECSKRIHDHFAPPSGQAYDRLDYATAFAMETNAQADCIARYPLSN